MRSKLRIAYLSAGLAVLAACGPEEFSTAPMPAASAGSSGALGTAAGGRSGGGGSANTSTARICDGSSGLRFAWSVAPWSRGGVFEENGLAFLFISGECEFYAWSSAGETSPYSYFSPVRQGKLSATEEQELITTSHYGSWDAWYGRHFESDPFELPHSSGYVLSDGTGRLGCSGGCSQSNPEVWSTILLINGRLDGLYARGTDLMGPMRLRVTQVEAAVRPDFIDWPLPDTLPLSKLSPPLGIDQGDWGPAQSVTNVEDLKVLRALRPMLMPPNNPPIEYAKHEKPGMAYMFSYRDVVPFENERGFIPVLYNGY